MNATQEMGKLQLVAITKLRPSPNNTRKTRDKDADGALVQSVKALGIVVPLIIRAEGDGFEVVAGHRRLDAAKAAGLESVPCIVKDIDTDDAAIQRVVENSDREELPPVEEAEALVVLVKKLGGDVKEAAARLGKPAAYVAGRLDLMALSEKVLQAIKTGELPLSWALEFRRVPDHKGQDELLEECLSDGYRSPKSAGDVRKLVEEKYSLDLARAPFDTKDAKLCPSAGACVGCPKQTQAQAQLFDGLGSKAPAICRDRVCFDDKVKAHVEAKVAAGKAGSAKVLTGAAADKALEEGEQNYGDSKYMALHLVHSGVTGHQALKAADPGLKAHIVTAVSRDGRAVELYPRKQLLELINKAAQAKSSSGPRKKKSEAEKKAEAKHQAEVRARKRKERLDSLTRHVAAEMIERNIEAKGMIKGPLVQVMAGLCREALVGDADEHLAKIWGLKVRPSYLAVHKVMEAAVNDPKKALKLIAYGCAWQGGPLQEVKARVKVMGVDWAKAEAGAKAWLEREDLLAAAEAKVRKHPRGVLLTKAEQEVLKAAGWTTTEKGYTEPNAKK